jgi:hypothetical protein
MRVMTCGFVLIAALSLVGPPVYAQEGHPLTGAWVGDWGPSRTDRNPVLLVLTWDGAIKGTINPGTDNIPIKNATLNPNGWILRIEAEGKDRSGRVLNYVFEGKIENIAMAKRSISGTWRHQSASGDFMVTRQ